jgi:phosphoribosylglycinamide formyltransferase-1
MGKTNLRIAAFAYDFPHKKTQEGLFELHVNGIRPTVVIGAPPVKLTFPTSKERIAPRGLSYNHPADVCRCLGITYVSEPHDSEHCKRLLRILEVDLGIVLGARILKRPTINACKVGILNMHPGILPGNRGLDNLKWSVLNDLPIGVTAHLIDEYVDRGRLVSQKVVPVYKDDTLRDVFLRQQDVERQEMLRAIALLDEDSNPDSYELLGKGTRYRAVPELFELGLARAWNEYKLKHGQ